MKKILLIVTVFLSVLQGVAQDRVSHIREKLISGNRSSIIVAAHRGDWRNFPENSLEGIENAIKMGVDIVEIDIKRTKDGELILMHDYTLDRTTTGRGKVSEVTLDSIKKLNLRNGCAIRTIHKIPTLEEVLTATKGRVMLNLDHADKYFDQIYEILKRTGTMRQIIMKGHSTPQVVKEKFGKYINDVIYMPIVNLDKPNAEEQIEEFISYFQPVAFELLYVHDANPLPKKLAKSLKGRTLIWYNTLWDTMAGGHDDDISISNPDKGYGYLIDELNAGLIQTDRPQYLIDYLKTRNLHD